MFMITIPPDGGIRYDSMGDSMRFVLTAAATQGQYTLIEDTIKPGFHAALHLHRSHSETFYMLEGTITFTIGLQEVIATSGTTIFVGPGVPHAAQAAAPAKMLTIFSPGGLEGAMEAFGRLTPEEAQLPAAYQAIMDTYDIVDLAQGSLPGLLGFYQSLLAGNAAAVLALFPAEPSIDTPLAGAVQGEAAVRAFVATQQIWLNEREAQPRFVNLIVTPQRIVLELVLELIQAGAVIDLPVALVAEQGDGGVTALRIYHSTWPLTGEHTIRKPLLTPPAILPTEPPLIERYMEALERPDMEAMLGLFSADGYVREPSGERYKHSGTEGRKGFYSMALNAGGVVLYHCSATFDGNSFAVEYICDRWGQSELPPQAGMAVYEFAAADQLRAVRIYDDVSPPFDGE
jgi:quercetin dioxygenase-like cupin family protein